MTIQIGDIYKYDEQEYKCLRSTSVVFNPYDYGFQPESICTSCWRGYWCEYEIKDNRITLKTLHIHDVNDYYPAINGVSISPWEYMPALTYTNEGLVPTEIPRYFGHETYERLELSLPFTGKIILGLDISWRRIVKSLSDCRNLLCFEFDTGKLERVNDYSEIVQIIPKVYKRFGITENVNDDIYESFPDNYREALWWYMETAKMSPREHKKLSDFLLDLDENRTTLGQEM